MKSFFKTLSATVLGVIIASILLSAISAIMFFAIIAGSGSSEKFDLKDKTILQLDLNQTISDRGTSNPFASLFGGSKDVTLDDVLSAIKKAKENDKIKGIYIKSGSLSTGISDLEPIHRALKDFKESGKFLVSYGDYYSQGAYYLASLSDKVIMNPKGSLDFHGLGGVMEFSRGKYEKLGIKFQVFKVGTFKSAVEPYIQDKMSDANRLQTASYLGDIWNHWLTNISDSRNISVEKLNEYADKFLAFSEAEDIVTFGMIDSLMYTPQVDDYLKSLVEIEKDKKLKFASISNMSKVEEKKKENSKSSDKIAVLYAEGAIVDEEAGAMFMGGSVITPQLYVKELLKLRDDKNVKAVVFRVNSPGGSAYASEQIWNAVKEVKAKKPIIVSMGTYAASGGYYISCAADSILAEPTTLTGSIGIFGLIPEGTELAKKMGVTFDEVKTNKHSAFGGRTFGIPFLLAAQSRGMNLEESQMIQKHIENGYDLFLSRCADGRGKTKAQIDEIGQGRVWTGKQALELGLVDKIGGLKDAIEIAAKKANMEENYKVSTYPAKKDFMEELMKSSLDNVKVSLAKSLMGETEQTKNK